MSKRKRTDDAGLPPREPVVTADKSQMPDDWRIAVSDPGWWRGSSDRVSSKTASDWQQTLQGGLCEMDYPTPDLSQTPDPSLPRFAAAAPDWSPDDLLFDPPRHNVLRRANDSERVC